MSPKGTLKLLVVDDDSQNLNLIKDALARQDVEVHTCTESEKARELFQKVRPRVVLLDIVMPKLNGIDLLKQLIAMDPGVDIILMTGQYSTDSALEAIQSGATDYITKPLDIGKLRSRIDSLISEAKVRSQTMRLDHELLDMYQFEGMVARSPLMLDVFAKIRRVAPHFRTVLVTGATGTGKELVARSLHKLSPSSGEQLAVCNCSALVETLMESELFGHVKGSFTGAIQDKQGLFEYANGGTVFLDEIGELYPAGQAKLLRVLQEHQVQRVGSPVTRQVDVRVIAATNRNLRALVREGRFREDLYYRLAVVEIALPSLADRREDLPLLQRYFVQKYASEYGKDITGISRRAQSVLAKHAWPGNIRELENVIGHACMMAEGPVIDIDDLSPTVKSPASDESDMDNSRLSLEQLQKRHVLRVLDSVGGNKARAAEILGIGRATIYEMLNKWKVTAAEETIQ
jgi:DNA-binding NtrC family response regulator